MNKIALIATTLLIATTAGASAASIDATKDRQADRIERGRETGKITWTEGLKLRAEQRRIANKEAAYRSDGHLSTSERNKLKGMQADAAQNISDQKNDGWRRVWWLPRVGR
jgi:hypothetical protein